MFPFNTPQKNLPNEKVQSREKKTLKKCLIRQNIAKQYIGTLYVLYICHAWDNKKSQKEGDLAVLNDRMEESL